MRMFLLVPLLATACYAAYQQPNSQEDYEDDSNYVSGGYGGPAGPSDGHHDRPGPSYGGGPGNGGIGPHHGGGGGGQDYGHHQDGSGGGGSDNYDVAEEWKPYSFSYSAHDPEGSHSHQQQADSKNRVTGQYSIMMADGRMRIVKYIADENGFRAQIVTNEQGTESKNPADVSIQSTAPTGEEAAKKFGGAKSNSRYDRYSQQPQTQQGDQHHTGGNSAFVGTSGPGHAGGHHGGSHDTHSYSSQQGGGHSSGGYDQGGYSDGPSYSRHDSQRYSHHDAQDVYSKGQNDYQPSAYPGHSSTGYTGHPQAYNQPAPATYGAAPAPISNAIGGGGGRSTSYGNDISEFEDDSHHGDTGYYSGTGSRSYGGSKASRHSNKASYG